MIDEHASATGSRIGIVGLGKMGGAIAARLAAAGFAVSGWTRRGVSDDEAEALGIKVAPNVASLLENADIVLLSLPDDAAVIAVLSHICAAGPSGTLIVDTSTVSPETLRGQAAAIEAAGGAVLDAPISGWPTMVTSGKAGLYVCGRDSDVARFMPVAQALSNRIYHVGDLGAGTAAKIVNNMMLAGYWQCLKEAMQVGKKTGLGAEKMLDILTGSPAANGSLAAKSPVILGRSNCEFSPGCSFGPSPDD
ncbi:MAG: NAD(P)-dependent oxidoreductase [Hyphomicrobiales bacterium]|nr:NAD(P)-dependent oxidoreductase [Hyphomicrobiales bacterium]